MRLPPSRVMAENAGGKKSRRREREPTKRAPHEILGAHGVRQGLAQSGVGARGARGIEEGKVGVLLGSLDQPRTELRLAEDRFEIFGQKGARQLQLPRAEARGDRGGGKPGAKLDCFEFGGSVPPVPGISLQDNALLRLLGNPERTGAEKR